MAYRIFYQLCGPTRNRGLLDNDGTWSGVLSDDGCHSFEGGHVGGAPGPRAAALGGGIDGNQDDIGLTDTPRYLCCEEQIRFSGRYGEGLWLIAVVIGCGRGILNSALSRAVSRNPQDIIQAWLINRGVQGVPSSDTSLISVDNADLDVWVLEGNNSGSRSAWIVSA